jgi:predicted RNA-binding Zn ribbon-like protein
MIQASSEISPDLCLDFSNTVDWRTGPRPFDKIQSYASLVAWASKTGLLDPSTSKVLLNESASKPSKALATLNRARELREAIYRIFSSVSHRKSPQAGDLDLLNQSVSKALARLEISRGTNNQFSWKWKLKKNALGQMLSPIAKSAADLLVSDQLHLVKECANEEEGCSWLFIDTSKNHSRRWCSMSSCGNRSKVRSYYQRGKGLVK